MLPMRHKCHCKVDTCQWPRAQRILRLLQGWTPISSSLSEVHSAAASAAALLAGLLVLQPLEELVNLCG